MKGWRVQEQVFRGQPAVLHLISSLVGINVLWCIILIEAAYGDMSLSSSTYHVWFTHIWDSREPGSPEAGAFRPGAAEEESAAACFGLAGGKYTAQHNVTAVIRSSTAKPLCLKRGEMKRDPVSSCQAKGERGGASLCLMNVIFFFFFFDISNAALRPWETHTSHRWKKNKKQQASSSHPCAWRQTSVTNSTACRES